MRQIWHSGSPTSPPKGLRLPRRRCPRWRARLSSNDFVACSAAMIEQAPSVHSRHREKKIVDFEHEAMRPYPRTLAAIQRALEVAGVEFLPDNAVRLKSPRP